MRHFPDALAWVRWSPPAQGRCRICRCRRSQCARQVFDDIAQTWKSCIISGVMKDKSFDSGMTCVVLGTPHTVRRCRLLTTAKFLVDLGCSSYRLWVSRIPSDAFSKGFGGWRVIDSVLGIHRVAPMAAGHRLRSFVHHREILLAVDTDRDHHDSRPTQTAVPRFRDHSFGSIPHPTMARFWDADLVV